MKNQFIASILLLVVGCVASQAQVDTDEWSVFEPKTGETKTVELSQMVPMAIVGPDDREPVTPQSPKWERAVVVLEMELGKGRMSACSGAMVGPNIVLTAAHCLNKEGEYVKAAHVYAVGMQASGEEQPQPPSKTPPSDPKDPQTPFGNLPSKPNPPQNSKEVVVRRLLDYHNNQSKKKSLGPILDRIVGAHASQYDEQSGTEKSDSENKPQSYPSSTAKQLWVPGEWIRLGADRGKGGFNPDRDEAYDYGIVVLEQPLGDQTGWLNLAVPSDQELKGAEILVLGRGGDKPRRTLWEAKGRVGKVYKRYFLHSADQVHGNSGGPIMNVKDRNHRIIALANFGYDDNPGESHPNGGLRITNKIISAVAQSTSN